MTDISPLPDHAHAGQVVRAPKRMTQTQLDSFSLICERKDLNAIAGTLDLLCSQFVDANEGSGKRRALDGETLNRWCDAASFLRMSVRRLIGQLETAEAKVSGKPARNASGAWDFWEGGDA